MKFSVLMSVYKNDNSNYLLQALESIYDKQTLKPDEIVIVFDGKLTDSLYAVIDDFSKDKTDIVKKVVLDTNQGLGNALKIGITYCSHEIVCRMDSDDISVSERFEKQIEYMKFHPEIDVVGSCISEFSTSPEEILHERIVPEDHDSIVKMAKKRNPINHMTVCMRKSAVESCGNYETVLYLEDYYLWVKMIARDRRLANLPQSLVYARTEQNFTQKRASKVKIKGCKKLQQYMLENKMVSKSEAFMNMVIIYGLVYCPDFVRKFVYKHFLRK